MMIDYDDIKTSLGEEDWLITDYCSEITHMITNSFKKEITEEEFNTLKEWIRKLKLYIKGELTYEQANY